MSWPSNSARPMTTISSGASEFWWRWDAWKVRGACSGNPTGSPQLASIASHMREVCGFRLAVIGFEVSGSVRAEEIATAIADKRGYSLLPAAGASYLPATM